MRHLTEEDLVLHHYRESTDVDVAEHLMACPECRAELERLKAVLSIVDRFEAPEPDERFEENVWNRLRWKLPARKSRVRWVPAMSVAAMLVIAFLGGRIWQKSMAAPEVQSLATVGASPEAQNRVFLFVVGDHFDQSERVLLELTRSDPSGASSVSSEQRLAEDLLSANRIYRQTALQSGDTRLATVLEELEPILLEIARTPADSSDRSIESLRRRIDASDLVFKLRVAGEQIKQRKNEGGSDAPSAEEVSL